MVALRSRGRLMPADTQFNAECEEVVSVILGVD